jgi:hypothetical protein
VKTRRNGSVRGRGSEVGFQSRHSLPMSVDASTCQPLTHPHNSTKRSPNDIYMIISIEQTLLNNNLQEQTNHVTSHPLCSNVLSMLNVAASVNSRADFDHGVATAAKHESCIGGP